MKSQAVVFNSPKQLSLQALDLPELQAGQLDVAVEFSGISTGTERMLWDGSMPPFPGMGYPLVPGYETVGRVVRAASDTGVQAGQRVFVPGANCFTGVKSLFGGAASRLVVTEQKVVPVAEHLGAQSVLLALAATAYHAVSDAGKRTSIVPPDLIVGHGVLGRLLARMVVLAGFAPPTVWEINAARQGGSQGYPVVDPKDDPRRDYRAIYDVSGDAQILDQLVMRLAPGGEIVLAGFYTEPLHFMFAPAFMREAQIRCAAEWKRPDLLAVKELAESGRLSLDGLITHHDQPAHADTAYRTAFGDPDCLKMVLDWRHCQ
jgi:3-hydroxyethyl bacteriochlorophyllide a dehydrogenase